MTFGGTAHSRPPQISLIRHALCLVVYSRTPGRIPAAVHSLRRNNLHLEDAILLFRRLGVDVQSLPPHEFTRAYFRLARRYHPDQGNRNSHELMAHINAARTAILKAHGFDEDRS